MLKHTFRVSWWIGILFSQKKVTENHETYQFAYIGGTYVFTPLGSVPIGSSKTRS